MINQKASFLIPKYISLIFHKFKNANYQIYLVGGAVRDLIQKKPVQDWDFTTNAIPKKILKLFPKNSFYNNKFGTVTIIYPKNKIEITTFRSEKGYSDRRHPDKIIWGKTIEEDLARRDFTIDAIALKPIKEIASFPLVEKRQEKIDYLFAMIDPFEGKKDLKNKLIRAVGNPQQRFNEDALRMLRAIRISSQLGFIIEENTFKAIQENVSLIKNISAERIRDELLKILSSPFAAEGFIFLRNSGLLKFIIPELEKGYGLHQAKHHIYDVWTHSIESLRYCPSKDPLVRFATLLHDIGKPLVAKGKGEKRTFHNHEVVGAQIAKKIAFRLKLSKKEIEKLWKLIRWHQFTVDERQTDKAIKRFIRKVGKENLKDILDLRIGDRLGGGAKKTSWRLELFKKRLAGVQKQPLSLKDLKIDGYDVMNVLKIPPGPKVGKVLKIIFNEVEENKEKNTREYLLARIPQIAKKI